ncbi:uncharacterized protein [Coffea arabica]|uniref:Increased DNA methylation 1-like n=1 Tax=Coffea arabica TaxID=13443 RepID=A0A6P6S998_COFAR|nr:uncharacterized protein LOC113689065 [Coffea arabica]
MNFPVKVRPGMKREYAFLMREKKLSPVDDDIGGENGNRRVTRSQKGGGKNFHGWIKFEDSEEKEDTKSDVIDVRSDEDDEVTIISRKPKDKRRAKSVKVDFLDYDDVNVNCHNGVSFDRNSASLKDLLETGLLEGLPVHYVCGSMGENKAGEAGLRGEIRGCGITCFCDACKGSRVLSPDRFELHARSGKNCAADNIYLRNGKSLRDILNACKEDASSDDSLAVRVLKAIAFSQAKANNLCDSLRESEDQTTQSTDRVGSRPTLPASSKNSSAKCPRKKVEGKLTKKDLRLHKVVFESNLLADGTPLGYYSKGKKVLSGYKSGSGIFCYCCNKVVSPSTFEAHAGYAARRKPYHEIYTSDGVSLHEWALAIKRNLHSSVNQSDDICSVCEGVGELLCCDLCPRAFHHGCVDLPRVPEGTWYCRCCVNMLKNENFVEHNANAVAAGRVAGIDPVEEVRKRCVRIIGASETDVGGCVICRVHDYNESDFGPRTVIICDQCEREYHVGCLKDHGMDDLQELPSGNWFCSRVCSSIYSALQQLVSSREQKLPDSLLSTMKKKHEDDADLNVSWRLLQGKMASEESRKWLSDAVSVFHERFDPIGDPSKSNTDLIPSLIYGKSNRDQDYGGMFCAVLTVNSIVVSAGIFRIFGQDVAEIPLVATTSSCQGKGYFQSLFCCIENLLASVNVTDLVLPAAHEAESMWKNKFGFRKISPERLKQYRRDHQLMTFLGTSVLHRRVSKLEL